MATINDSIRTFGIKGVIMEGKVLKVFQNDDNTTIIFEGDENETKYKAKFTVFAENTEDLKKIQNGDFLKVTVKPPWQWKNKWYGEILGVEEWNQGDDKTPTTQPWMEGTGKIPTPTETIDTPTKSSKTASKSQKTGTDKPSQEYWEAKDANITRIAIFKSTLEAVSNIYNHFTPSDVDVTLAEHLKIVGADVIEMTLSFEKALFKKEK